MCQCVYDCEGTSKQFNGTFHTHAKNKTNTMKNSHPQIPSKEAHASFRSQNSTLQPNSHTNRSRSSSRRRETANSLLVLRSCSTVRLDTASSDSIVAPYFPSFTSRLNGCCHGGTVHFMCSGPKRPSFTKDSRRPIFTSRHCVCCINGTGCPLCSGPGKPSSTKRHSFIKLCRSTLLCDSRRPRVQTRLCDLDALNLLWSALLHSFTRD